MENFVNVSLRHLHQVDSLPPPLTLLAHIGQTPLQLMPLANLGKSSKVYELPHSSAIGSQWMTKGFQRRKGSRCNNTQGSI
jgi:hypothetical protein